MKNYVLFGGKNGLTPILNYITTTENQASNCGSVRIWPRVYMVFNDLAF